MKPDTAFHRTAIPDGSAVDVLSEKDKLTVNVRRIYHRTRGVAWPVDGSNSTAADGQGRFFALQFDINGKRF